jgi:hypothetical protein
MVGGLVEYRIMFGRSSLPWLRAGLLLIVAVSSGCSHWPDPKDRSRSVPILGRRSGHLPVMVQETSEPRFTDDLSHPARCLPSHLDQTIRQPSTVPLAVVVLDVLRHCDPQLLLRTGDTIHHPRVSALSRRSTIFFTSPGSPFTGTSRLCSKIAT